MKTLYRTRYIAMAALVFLAAAFVIFSGCSSQHAATAPAAPSAPAATTAPAGASAQVTGGGTTVLSLPHGVSLALPAGWQRDDTVKSGVRDYGRDTENIANFHSPTIPGGDRTTWNTLSIDFDRDPEADFEGYFNTATMAVEKTYHTETMVSLHSSTMDISGHKAYELRFDAYQVRGYYFFTRTDSGIYIFAFKGPDRQPGVTKLQDDALDMAKSIQISP